MQSEGATSLFKHPGVRGLLFVIVGLAVGWLLFAEGDDEGEWDPDEIAAMLEQGELPPEMQEALAAQAYLEEDFELPDDFEAPIDIGGGYGGGEEYYPAQGGGWGEAGAYRGEAEVGGVPLTSGTVDTSGGGNSVHSVGGKVIELP